MADGDDLCTHCGAPRAAGYAACKFCKTPYPHVKNTQTNAIPCPRCNTLNEVGQQKCVQCQTWIVVQCVFCHALSPHNMAACSKCGEAFAGAPQRFQERQSQQRLQTGLNIAGQVGNVAASVLGAAAVAGLVGGRSHQHHHYDGGHSHHHYGGHHDGGYDHHGGASVGYFGGSDEGTGAGIEQSSEPSGGGFFDSIFGGSSDSAPSSSGGSSGSFWDSSDSGSSDSGSSDSGDSGGGFWDSDD